MHRIPSIHKYCNRWCDRCSFRTRCGFYLAKHDEKGEIDWSEGLEERSASISHPFQALDLDQAKALEQKLKAREKAGPFNIDKEPLILLYQKWEAKYHNLQKDLQTSKHYQKLEDSAFLKDEFEMKLDNAVQVLDHYHDFIGPKLMRALGGKHDELNLNSSNQSDWNGTAKVAAYAIKHLRLALEDLFELRIALQTDLAEFLGDTNRLLRTLSFEFPDLEKFIRPGFDSLGHKRISGIH